VSAATLALVHMFIQCAGINCAARVCCLPHSQPQMLAGLVMARLLARPLSESQGVICCCGCAVGVRPSAARDQSVGTNTLWSPCRRVERRNAVQQVEC
jgi:hypothetical protein